jgi:hypothetical protein
MKTIGRMRALGLALILAAVGGAALLSSGGSGSAFTQGAGGTSEPALDSNSLAKGFSRPDHPFPGGRQASAEETNQALEQCRCPAPEDSGGAAPNAVAERWRQGKSNVGLVLRSGVWVTYTADARSSEQYALDAQTAIAEGFWDAQLVLVRGTTGAGAERTETGSAYLAWIEGGHLTELFGFGEQSLLELQSLAEGMRAPRSD